MFQTVKVSDVRQQMGNYLRMLRKREGLTQEALGELLGFSRVTIYNIETGKNANLNTFLLILEHFGELEQFSRYIVEQGDVDDAESIY